MLGYALRLHWEWLAHTESDRLSVQLSSHFSGSGKLGLRPYPGMIIGLVVL
jgi:hypothetical protein